MMTERLSTIGVKPTTPTFFWDFDRTPLNEIMAWISKSNIANFDVYNSSEHRFHLVFSCQTWDQVQEALIACKKQFPTENYIMNCRRLRLRITAKYNHHGIERTKAPMLVYCGCPAGHVEKRVGIAENYFVPVEIPRSMKI